MVGEVSSELLYVTGFDVESRHEADFNEWYGAEYLPSMLELPGWLGVRRYECLQGEPAFLDVFDLGPEALDVDVVPAPFRDPAFSRWIRDYRARSWRRVFAAGEDPAEAELINLVTVEIAPAHAAAFDRWYSEKHTPEIIACPGWLGGERFHSTRGKAEVMAIYGLEDAERPFATPEYESVVGWEEHVDHIRGYHGFRVYRLLERIGGPE